MSGINENVSIFVVCFGSLTSTPCGSPLLLIFILMLETQTMISDPSHIPSTCTTSSSCTIHIILSPTCTHGTLHSSSKVRVFVHDKAGNAHI